MRIGVKEWTDRLFNHMKSSITALIAIGQRENPHFAHGNPLPARDTSQAHQQKILSGRASSGALRTSDLRILGNERDQAHLPTGNAPLSVWVARARDGVALAFLCLRWRSSGQLSSATKIVAFCAIASSAGATICFICSA